MGHNTLTLTKDKTVVVCMSGHLGDGMRTNKQSWMCLRLSAHAAEWTFTE